MAATPAAFIFSTSALPPSGVDWASPSTASIFAAAERLDAAGRIDLLHRHLRAEAALLSGVGQGARDWVQNADLDGRALRAQYRRGGKNVARRPAPWTAGTCGG